MRPAPLDIGTIHFVGIGGIGMSGIAEVMRNLGYEVQGSDVSESANVKRLRTLGIPVKVGHAASNLGDAHVVVVSSAIKPDNPELVEARARFLPIVRRAEMLAELMRLKSCVAIAGTHGKTTTTSLVAALLDGAGLDPTVINGGIINAYGTNARLGAGEWMVVEADESDGTFVKLPATIAIVTNIDPEHLDYYGTFEAAKDAFLTFVENVPFYGCAVMCIDHPEVQALIGRVRDRRIVTYGTSPQADIRATNPRVEKGLNVFDVTIADRKSGQTREIPAVKLPMHGRHNMLNSLAAMGVALQMGIPEAKIRKSLESFGGVKRRFTHVGAWNGVDIYDDYGHHPVEIAAVLQAARSACSGRIVAVVQPHRYTRLHNLFDEFCACFNDADTVVVADVYAAGEAPIEGADKASLVAGLHDRGHRDVIALDGPEALPKLVSEIAKPGDFVVCLGAGSITYWANALPADLAALSTKPKKAAKGDKAEKSVKAKTKKGKGK
ncbi:MAG TPA: UDP-N-acetylmuramate--L-alanine ligase [Parvibaculum sp.]|uniref:UDP-N-acetylmuramate--L-alanine ligase n=2 Tax=Parvibaculum sp. TaxID=2024848 RepID=UPI002CD08D66|nr:UDP-N-acetylmuramate--L-alanine ligase [Parvibaculum sp.]HMM14859.1 UDP-N-acetylmuramate--L-alanine ligase [Parvibaculum sp.]